MTITLWPFKLSRLWNLFMLVLMPRMKFLSLIWSKPVKIYDLARKWCSKWPPANSNRWSWDPSRWKTLRKNSWCPPNLLITKLWIRFSVGKVNVMPLEAIDQRLKSFTLSGDELKQAIIAFVIKQPTLNKKKNAYYQVQFKSLVICVLLCRRLILFENLFRNHVQRRLAV